MRRLLDAIRLAHLTYFSKPPGDRIIYRAIRRNRARRILEVGLRTGQRARRMIEAATRGTDELVNYAGIDLFELRPPAESDGLSLKEIHSLLKTTPARVRLIPGDPFTALARMANEIGSCDLIVIASDQPTESLERAWFYVPRLLHAATSVFIERPGSEQTPARFELLAHDEIRRRAAQCRPRRRAA
ncbi:MAG TPA: hypothetical protein VJ783_08725 [Pirellulales bacterium]|nr:hypothetical protein [Pirellulales bacterium]